MNNKRTLITAAGGNGTAIEVIDQPLTRGEYELRGKWLGRDFAGAGAEQAGFLVLGDIPHFEMAGGEFCGNATRAAAVLIAQANEGQETLEFTVSGFAGTVRATVSAQSSKRYMVRCEFAGMPTEVSLVLLRGKQKASIVDLGGIVHVVIKGRFLDRSSAYERLHREITQLLGLRNREAVGVIWYETWGGTININPVVWVKAIDSFFYETSCGSGTIAVGKVTGESTIVQPTGKSITVEITEGSVALTSEMEIVS